jgi:hypothetical protein
VVWEAMLARQPLRFLLSDDPGAGKTSMAGLFIKELTSGDFDRCLVVSPAASPLASRPLPSRRSPSRSIGPDAPVGEGNPLKFDQTPLFPRSSLIPFRTSSRTPTHASPKRLRILCAPNFQIVDDLDAILAKLARRRHRPRARGL